MSNPEWKKLRDAAEKNPGFHWSAPVLTMLNQLETYGDHKFKCAVRKQLRADVLIVKPCDCGWQEIASA